MITRCSCILGLTFTICLLSASAFSAAVYQTGFEPPTFTTGALVGQPIGAPPTMERQRWSKTPLSIAELKR